MANKYPNSGILSEARTRVHPNSPHYNGDITIDKSLLNQMMEEQEGDEIKIRLSGWVKEGNYGPFISISVNTYKKDVPDQQPAATPKQAQLETLPVDDSDIPF